MKVLIMILCALALATAQAQEFDESPMSSFSHDGETLHDAVISRVNTDTVELTGKGSQGESYIEIPWDEALKNWQLRSRLKNAIAAREAAIKDAANENSQEARDLAGAETGQFEVWAETQDGLIGYFSRPLYSKTVAGRLAGQYSGGDFIGYGESVKVLVQNIPKAADLARGDKVEGSFLREGNFLMKEGGDTVKIPKYRFLVPPK